MKTSQATQKIKNIKRYYLSAYLFVILLISLLLGGILFIYLSSQYMDLKFCLWIKDKLSFLYIDNFKLQLLINICSSVVIILIDLIVIFVQYYIYNSRYQKRFLEIFFDELKLNEIYLLEKRVLSVNSGINFIDSTLNLKDMNYEHLFSVKSLFTLNFHQLFSKDQKFKNGILISSESDKELPFFIDIKFEDLPTISESDNKGIYKFIYNAPNRYPYPLYINTNLGINTYKVFNEKIINKIYELKRYTRSNFMISIHKKMVCIYIDNWELRITDSLRKKLTYNSIDKKIDSFTKLVDDLQDLYICILRNYEVIKYGK